MSLFCRKHLFYKSGQNNSAFLHQSITGRVLWNGCKNNYLPFQSLERARKLEESHIRALLFYWHHCLIMLGHINNTVCCSGTRFHHKLTLVSISTRTAAEHNELFDHIILIRESLLSLMHENSAVVPWKMHLMEETGKKRTGVRQDIDSIF